MAILSRTSILCRILFSSTQIVCCPFKYPLCLVLFFLFLPTWQWKSAMFGYLGAQFNFMQNLPSSQLFVVHINILCAWFFFVVFADLTMNERNVWLSWRAVQFYAESSPVSIICCPYKYPVCFVLFFFLNLTMNDRNVWLCWRAVHFLQNLSNHLQITCLL